MKKKNRNENKQMLHGVSFHLNQASYLYISIWLRAISLEYCLKYFGVIDIGNSIFRYYFKFIS